MDKFEWNPMAMDTEHTDKIFILQQSSPSSGLLGSHPAVFLWWGLYHMGILSSAVL